MDGRWEEPEAYDGVDLPDDDFDYGEFIRNEFGEGELQDRSFRKTFWWAVAVITLICLCLDFVPLVIRENALIDANAPIGVTARGYRADPLLRESSCSCHSLARDPSAESCANRVRKFTPESFPRPRAR